MIPSQRREYRLGLFVLQVAESCFRLLSSVEAKHPCHETEGTGVVLAGMIVTDFRVLCEAMWAKSLGVFILQGRNFPTKPKTVESCFGTQRPCIQSGLLGFGAWASGPWLHLKSPGSKDAGGETSAGQRPQGGASRTGGSVGGLVCHVLRLKGPIFGVPQFRETHQLFHVWPIKDPFDQF